jgi:hypothetical protein
MPAISEEQAALLSQSLSKLRQDLSRSGDEDASPRVDETTESVESSLRQLHSLCSLDLYLDQQCDIIDIASRYQQAALRETVQELSSGQVWSEFLAVYIHSFLDILKCWDKPKTELMVHLLLHNVKPLFRHSVHPSVNPSRGSALSRPMGGMATQDLYDHQTWKQLAGTTNLLLWCVEHIEVFSAVRILAFTQVYRERPMKNFGI